MEHARVAPRLLPFRFLQEITDNFSQERILGAGAYGTVYKGEHKDGENMAIKKLHSMPGLSEKQFEKEYLSLASLQHQNIVRLVAYCKETHSEWVEIPGRTVLAEIQHMALCFEYMSNGSLANYLQDESAGEDWHIRYAIIKRVCKGLKYLHEELKPPVYHLDLKPGNILLDEKMTPKIADFGLSKLFGDERTREIASAIGTPGYLPPEYIEQNKVSNKLDIFSLGVIIIKLMTGHDGYSQTADMSAEQFIELTHGKWQKRLQRTSNDSIESYAEQVKTCIKIALSCVEVDRHKRPNIGDIVSKLDGTGTTAQFSHGLTITRGSTAVEEEEMRPSMSSKSELVDAPGSKDNKLLNVHSSQLCFPFFEPNKPISCFLQLSNNTDADVAFRVLPERNIEGLLNLSGIVPPRSARTYLVLLEKQPPANVEEFDVTLQSCIAHNDAAEVDDNFIPEVLELIEGNKMHEVTLKAIISDKAGAKMTSESIRTQTKIICSNIERQRHVVAMDSHPTEPWILIGQRDGSISVWNYDTKERVMEFGISYEIRSIIFIARKKWIVAGDLYGQIHVRSCVTTDEIKKFQPHSIWVVALAVHPNLSYLLSASEDTFIKLWNWEDDWTCLRTFKHTPSWGIIMFNPNNDCPGRITFTGVSLDGTVKIWKTSTPVPIETYNCKSEDVVCFDYPQTGDRRCIVTGSKAGAARVWDLQTQECVTQITGLQADHGYNVGVVDRSPDPPLLVVALENCSIGLYDPIIGRYENISKHKFGRIRRFVYIKAIRSVAIAHEGGLAIMELLEDPSGSKERTMRNRNDDRDVLGCQGESYNDSKSSYIG